MYYYQIQLQMLLCGIMGISLFTLQLIMASFYY